MTTARMSQRMAARNHKTPKMDWQAIDLKKHSQQTPTNRWKLENKAGNNTKLSAEKRAPWLQSKQAPWLQNMVEVAAKVSKHHGSNSQRRSLPQCHCSSSIVGNTFKFHYKKERKYTCLMTMRIPPSKNPGKRSLEWPCLINFIH